LRTLFLFLSIFLPNSDQKGKMDTQNQRWAQDKSAFGYKMMLKLGWSEGKGTGKHEDGAAGFVRVEKRPATLGIGAQHDAAGNMSFKQQIKGFNEVLASLNAAQPKKKGRKRPRQSLNNDDEIESSSSETKELLFPSERMEKKPKNRNHKQVCTRKSSTKEGRSAPAIGRKIHARTMQQKNVLGYSRSDLAAILGGLKDD